ncbi:hypothetical protein POM88_051135 [Heracleum sosnowskyi]|uniref:Uncharacterized protein n=1 Tax=Heracleum sosnowskyi TaxID=360622 RepID=A0AAD8GZW2_9APIA|nr:hypothetical protein POM88_051135 [Heracleum sosnowskyi]
MSSFIDNVETFDLTTLEFDTYSDKIDGLLQRFPKYEKDDSFRTVLPDKMIKAADDYVSIKFCTRGRYPIHGIYNRRDLNLIAICVEGNVMYALDDCDLHPSFVPDLKVHKICLGIQHTPLARRDVSLINDKDKTKRGKFRRKMNRWNGPLGNTKRKLREESHKRLVMEREERQIMKKMDDKSSEMMHGFWYGSVSTFNYEVACGKCLVEWSQMVSSNRFFRSATSYLGRLKDVLLAQRTLASILVAVKEIWNERSTLLTCFRGTSMVFEDRGSSLDGYGSYFWFKSPRPDPPLPGATYRAIVDYTRPMYSAAAFYKCAKRQKVSRKDLCFDHIGIVKDKIDDEKVKLNRGQSNYKFRGFYDLEQSYIGLH